MKNAERVERALRFQKPDRVPFIGYNGISLLGSDAFPLMNFTPKTWQPTSPGFYPHVDPLQLNLGLYRWQALGWDPKPKRSSREWKYKPHMEIDEWGVIWEDSGDGTMGWPVKGPLKSWDDLSDLQIPNGKDPSRYRLVRPLTHIIPKKSKFRLGLIGNFLFERTHFLRGWNNYMGDLIRKPEKVKELIKKILPFYEGMIHQLHEMGAQAVMTSDDWGSQEDVFISPKMFDNIFADAYKDITELCHNLGMLFILHSCGNIGKFIPKFIECGVDVLQLDSPRMTGLDVLGQYKGKIAYLCVVDIQTVYPNGTPADVDQEVKAMINTLGDSEGGFVATDYFGAGPVLKVPKANIRKFPQAVKKYGRYNP